MACASAVGLPSGFYGGSRTFPRNVGKIPGSNLTGGRARLGRRRYLITVVKVVGDGSNSSSESIVKYVQNVWGKSEDRLALVGLGFAAIAFVWASGNLITAIDKLPLIPSVLEFIGILFSWWFIYRYLLFKPNREELLKNVKSSLSDILDR
uniref:Thylakoid membrane phosphoprotein, chloroplastic n=1 Tax=Anthurium amnicola TaxID=1678845 RepID=A0A1D1ZKM1_9ARAE